MNSEELLRRLDRERDAYLATFQQLHEVLARNLIASSSPSSNSTPVSSTPRPVLDRVSRLSMGESERKAPNTFKSSFISGEDDDSDDDQALYVQDLLPSSTRDDEDLRAHLRTYKWNHESKRLLEDILTDEGRMKNPSLFPAGQNPDEDGSHYSLYQVFHVGTDGAPVPLHTDTSLMRLPKGQTMWHYIKDINIDATRRLAVGRITILREPSPTLFAAIHLTMNNLFDMDEIFEHLVQQGTTTAYMTRAFSADPRKQRSFVFSFEYFTCIGDDCQPMTWQESDRERERKDGHIPISRCSAVVALSLVGEPYRKLKNSARRAKTQYGYVFDPWLPWHVLNIQAYPDWKSNTDSHDSTKHYVNGPDAFLNTLLVEYKDAQKRFEEISQRVTKLITPPPDFMFNKDLRDALLFENKDFTYSRRYFWAFQTLGTMNQSIKAMIDAYEDTFTKDVWEGRHSTLWPLADTNSSRNDYWKKRMTSLKKDFEDEIRALKVIMSENESRRKEIKNLRDQLFSGTSVLESRKSVEQTEITVQQGHNIKLLTLVNMFFLPLTFVTSIFGMTNMPPDADFWRFGIVMTTVCIPFFLLIGSMNTNRGMKFWTEQFTAFFSSMGKIFSRKTKAPSIDGTNLTLASENSVEKFNKQARSLSASEGMARRTGRVLDTEKNTDAESSPSPQKPISFGQPLPIQEEPGLEVAFDPIKAINDEAVKGEITTLPNPVPNLTASNSPTSEKMPAAITSMPSALAISGATVVSEIQVPIPAPQRSSLGLWDRLRPNKQRDGGKDYVV